jgi:hypothetical protein
MVSYTPKLKEILLAHPAQRDRFERPRRGDHEIWYSPITVRRFPVDHDIRSRHTANAVLKQGVFPSNFDRRAPQVLARDAEVDRRRVEACFAYTAVSKSP